MRLIYCRLLVMALLSGVALSGFCDAADSLPPLKDGKAPTNLDELWGDYDPGKEPLESEVLKEWEQDGVVCRVVRYQVGIFKGVPSKVAAFYAFPKGAAKLPAILEMHGGGQSASLNFVTTFAKRGYSAMSINWGGNKMSLSKGIYDGPQTDWGKLDATHPPQRNKVNHFAGPLTPDEFTQDAIESPRNSNWFLVLIAARRAVTFLEQQPEVDPRHIGACGHSMGGKLTTDLAGIEKRLKAAVPSCGGAGTILESQTDLPGCIKSKPSAPELACVSDNAYIPKITCPILWLSPTNDFNAPITNMAWNWRNIPDGQVRFSISPHLNHRHTDEHAITQFLWFENHLKSAFIMPKSPEITLSDKAGSPPMVLVKPDESTPVKSVAIYYSIDPHELSRFWRSASVERAGSVWSATCPIMSINQPIFVYVDVVYELPEHYRNVAQVPGQESVSTFAISSRVITATPDWLRAKGISVSDKQIRMIDDGTCGWRDWYQLNWSHAPLWSAFTRKLKDPKWRGPDGAKLVFEINSTSDNMLVITFNTNAWGAFVANKPAVDYTVVKELKGSSDWQTVNVSLNELMSSNPKITEPLENWQTVTEFSISPSGDAVKNGEKIKVNGKPWQGPREIKNLRWEGGEYSQHQLVDAVLSPEEHQKAFNDAIKKSLEQEKADQKSK